MKLQLLQFNVAYADVNANEHKIKTWFSNSLQQDTDVVILPEMWNNGYALEQLEEKADFDLERSTDFIKNLALQYQVDIIAGSVSNKHHDHIFNTAFAIDKTGKVINQYDKMHLVPMLDEPAFLTAGKNVPETFKLSNGVKVTQMICYDLRFPELLRYPARSGATIAFYVAQWPSARLNHWQVLLKARAIENNMYVIGCNGCGYDGKTQYAGHSVVINPNGEIIQELSTTEKELTVTIDIDVVEQQRKAIPVFDSLVPHLYK